MAEDKPVEGDLRKVIQQRRGKQVMVEETPKMTAISSSDDSRHRQNVVGQSGVQKSPVQVV